MNGKKISSALMVLAAGFVLAQAASAASGGQSKSEILARLESYLKNPDIIYDSSKDAGIETIAVEPASAPILYGANSSLVLPNDQVRALVSLARYIQDKTSAEKLVKDGAFGANYYFIPLGNRQADDSFDLNGFDLEYLVSTDDMGGCYGYTFRISLEGVVTTDPEQVNGNAGNRPANLTDPKMRKIFDHMLGYWLKKAEKLPDSEITTHLPPPQNAMRISSDDVRALLSLAKYTQEKTSAEELRKETWFGADYYFIPLGNRQAGDSLELNGFALKYLVCDDMGGCYGYTFRISLDGSVTAGNAGNRPANLAQPRVRKTFDDMLGYWVRHAAELSVR